MIRLLIGLFRILLFILATTINFEYLLNRQSNSLATIAAVVIELLLIYFLIIPLIKKLFK